MGGKRRIGWDTWKVVVVVVACLVLLGLLGRRVYLMRQADAGIDETGVVTVVSVTEVTPGDLVAGLLTASDSIQDPKAP